VPLDNGGEADVSRSIPWFPVIGALVGLAVAGSYAALVRVIPAPVAAAVAIAVGIMISGAFHHDGLADVADAFGGGWNREERLVILKDSRHGTYGVMAIVLAVAIQIASLAAMPPALACAVLVVAHALSRSGSVALMRWAPLAPTQGMGVDYARQVTSTNAVLAIVVGVALSALAVGSWLTLFTLAVAASCLVLLRLAVRKIGGVVGDVLGAAQQVGETMVLVVGSGIAMHASSPLWWQ